MDNKCTLAVLVAALFLMISCCSSKDMPSDKLKKSYEKINKYLEENVRSDDPEINMAKAEDLLREKSPRFSILASSMVDALKLIKEFSKMPTDITLCYHATDEKRRNLMEEIDSGLVVDNLKLKSADYHPNRIDRIIEHFAYRNTRRCKFSDGRWPNMKHAYKQLVYDEINRRLVDSLPETDDVETNMAKIEEMQRDSGARDGVLGRALEQFSMLNFTLSEESCNEKGYEILLKNDLATRGNAHNWFDKPSRRVDKIFGYFVKRHEKLCRSIHRQKLMTEMSKLDQETYRRILGLASSYYLSFRQYPELVEELNKKEVNGEFFTALMVKHAQGEIRYQGAGQLDQILTLVPEIVNSKSSANVKQTKSNFIKLYLYTKTISLNDPDSRYLDETFKNDKQKSSQVMVDEAKVRMLLSRYLFDPCNNYLERLEGLLEADEYGSNINDNHRRSGLDELIKDLSYHMAHAGYQACKYVNSNRDHIFHGIINSIKRTN